MSAPILRPADAMTKDLVVQSAPKSGAFFTSSTVCTAAKVLQDSPPWMGTRQLYLAWHLSALSTAPAISFLIFLISLPHQSCHCLWLILSRYEPVWVSPDTALTAFPIGEGDGVIQWGLSLCCFRNLGSRGDMARPKPTWPQLSHHSRTSRERCWGQSEKQATPPQAEDPGKVG
jgi:hypothetical protein